LYERIFACDFFINGDLIIEKTLSVGETSIPAIIFFEGTNFLTVEGGKLRLWAQGKP